jgi:hypothetical protein
VPDVVRDLPSVLGDENELSGLPTRTVMLAVRPSVIPMSSSPPDPPCPKCGAPLPRGSGECARCGLVLSKVSSGGDLERERRRDAVAERRRSKTIRTATAVGAAIAASPLTLFMGYELVQRVIYAVRGVGEESADWGEPLFYMIVSAATFGGGGAVVGAAVGNWFARQR